MRSLRQAFDELIDLSPSERAERLRDLRLDHAQERTLLAMLDAGADGPRVMAIPIDRAIDSLREDDELLRSLVGRRVGPFRVLDLIGEGGSSAVFRADRAAGSGSQIVALKLLRTGLFTAHGQQRFRREQAILAQLTHSNIARLVEGGISEAGIPYIAMEFVDGRPITVDASARGLGLAERLRMFVKLCGAIEAAHAALVVHRDIKPSNVFVDTQGELKVLDFGIAKLLDDDDDATRTQATIALTPGYAAPEQYQSGPITIAADIYALGVLLGELVTGSRLGGAAGCTASAAVLSDAIAPPNGLPEGALLARLLRGDIDAIIMVALADDPVMRYRSAGALAADVERFLDGRPVKAHAPSRWYRMRKFIARHRAALGLTAIFVLGMLISLAVALLQARRAGEAAARATATRDFLVEVFHSAEPAGARVAPPNVAEVTEAALARIEHDAALDPQVQLDLKTQLGSVLTGQSKLERAVAVLERAAADGAARYAARDPAVIDARLALGNALIAAGQFDAADKLGATLASDMGGQDQDRTIRYTLLAANIAGKRGRATEAIAHVQRAAALCADACGRKTRINVLEAQGVIFGTFERDVDAAAAYAEAVTLARQQYGDAHVEVASLLNGLSGTYRRLGRLQEAKRLAIEVLRIDDQVLPAVHWRRSVHLNYLGAAEYALGEYELALASFNTGIANSRAAQGDDDPTLGQDFTNVGMIYARLGQFDHAFENLGEALRRGETHLGAHSATTSNYRANLGYTRALSGDLAGAEPLMRQAVIDLVAAGDGARRLLAFSLHKQAKQAMWADDPAASLALVEHAIDIGNGLGGDLPEADRMSFQISRGVALVGLERSTEAQVALEPALHRLETLDAEFPAQAEANFELGLIALSQARREQAQQYLEAGRQALKRRPFVYGYLSDRERKLQAAFR